MHHKTVRRKILQVSKEVYMIEMQQATLAPEFSMIDSEGSTVRLSNYRDKKNVVLVFNRGFT